MKSISRHCVAAPPMHFRIGEIGLSLQTDMAEVRDEFASLYDGHLQNEPSRACEIAMNVVTKRRWPLGTRWSVCGDGEEVSKVSRREELMPFLEWGINYRVIATRADFLQLHAATMVRNGQGLIFAADSGAGKSTLAAGLLARRWKYLSDEFALINPRTLRLHAFPKALCIKAGAFDAVERAGLPLWRRRFYVKAYKGRVGYIRPQEVARDALADASPIRYVIFPRYVAGAGPHISPMPRAAAAMALSQFVLNHGALKGRAISIIADVVRRAECLRLDSGPLAETCDLMESIVGANRNASTWDEKAVPNLVSDM